MAGSDTITDFVRGTASTLKATQILLGNFAGGTGFITLETADTRLVYDRDSGTLWHDLHGSRPGGYAAIATLKNAGGLSLSWFGTADVSLIAWR